MIEEAPKQAARITALLAEMREISVAVSGGIDSVTLAMLATRTKSINVQMYHAVSPAVPSQATDRVKQLAQDYDWDLKILDAREFADEDYLSNPVNRCFYCKTNLYKAISTVTANVVLSGANVDDLSDYRPGLDAAKNAKVRHPFVETHTDKRMVRAIAKYIGLGELSELAASPCLSSRVETGIRIDPELLPLINESERLIKQSVLPEPKTVRCRLRATGIVIELDGVSLSSLTTEKERSLKGIINAVFEKRGHRYPVSFEAYKVGSAFIHIRSVDTHPF
ncbi:MAG: adenine nucleotide alpha hydrolase [Proteobacteria bacterium]|nr:adenine nucleotide alpha hydrolase [Pseudomonadota bacterium]MDA1331571.1 adenine nucleotide alpha hydrolase [Pseudomonadota bacterium]